MRTSKLNISIYTQRCRTVNTQGLVENYKTIIQLGKRIRGATPVLALVQTGLGKLITKQAMKGEKTMARVPMVTRTINTTKVVVMCLDTMSNKTVEKTVIVPRTYKDEEKLFKVVKPLVTEETVKPVYIVSTEELEKLYGMTEQKFVETAEELPPRTVKEN